MAEHGRGDDQGPAGRGKKLAPTRRIAARRGVKRSLLTEGHGVPVGLAVAGANRHDMKLTRETLESGVVPRPEPTAEHPQGLCLDKGYDYREVRDIVGRVRLHRPHPRPGRRSDGAQTRSGLPRPPLGGGTRAQLMNRFRRLLVRWEKKPQNYIAFLHFACGLIAFRAAGLFG
jgi:putative transposase